METATHSRLEDALRGMTFRVEDGRFALLGFAEPPVGEDLLVLQGAAPAQAIREDGETTLLVPESKLSGFLRRHPDARVERGLAWIRFEGVLPWDLVGFLARVTGALAEAGVPLGAISGYSRDHLFVAEAHLERARETLRRLFPEAPRR